MDYPKNKGHTPLGPIISGRGSTIYDIAKKLARVLQLFKGNTLHPDHIGLIELVKKTVMEIGECITSYHITTLFTSVIVEPAINMIQNRLEQDRELCQKNQINNIAHHTISGVLSSQYRYIVLQAGGRVSIGSPSAP